MRVKRLALVALGLSACSGPRTFVCLSSDECTLDGTQGTCQPDGYCSFPDPGCLSGQRYGEHAADALAGTCVESGAAPDADVNAPDARLGHGDAAGSADAGQTLFTKSFSPSGDAWIDSLHTSQNHGNDPVLRVSGDPTNALLRFEVSGIDGATVKSAELHVFTAQSGGLSSGSVQVFTLLESWSEGIGNGTDGAVNWISRDGTNDWSDQGAGAPGSRPATAVAEFGPAQSNHEFIVPLPVSLVQTWVGLGAPGNDGVVLVAKDAGNHAAIFVSDEGLPASKRPRLSVSYTLP